MGMMMSRRRAASEKKKKAALAKAAGEAAQKPKVGEIKDGSKHDRKNKNT